MIRNGSRNQAYFYVIFIFLAVLAGCASAPQPNNQTLSDTTATRQEFLIAQGASPPEPAPAPSSVTGKTLTKPADTADKNSAQPTLILTPLSTFEDQDLSTQNVGGVMADSYTRLIVTSNIGAPAKEGRLKYGYTPRFWLNRYLFGEEFDLSLSLKVTIGDYDSTIPLMTLSHDSNLDGEQWSRSVNYNALSFPWILVRSDGETSGPVFTATLKGTRTYKSGAAGASLQVALAAINQLAPSSTLLTKLSTQTAKTKAAAIDTAIGKLFSDGISEQHISQRDLRTWREGGGVSLTIFIPTAEDGDWDANLGTAGTWQLAFDKPRPSIFYDVRICAQDNITAYPTVDPADGKTKIEPYCFKDREAALAVVHAKVDSSSILNFHLIDSTSSATKDLGTIQAYLQQQTFFSTAMTSFKGTDADKEVTEKLCRGILTSMVAMGLNSVDSTMVVWAVSDGYALPSTMEEGAFSTPSCKRAINAVRPGSIPDSSQAPVVDASKPDAARAKPATAPGKAA